MVSSRITSPLDYIDCTFDFRILDIDILTRYLTEAWIPVVCVHLCREHIGWFTWLCKGLWSCEANSGSLGTLTGLQLPFQQDKGILHPSHVCQLFVAVCDTLGPLSYYIMPMCEELKNFLELRWTEPYLAFSCVDISIWSLSFLCSPRRESSE